MIRILTDLDVSGLIKTKQNIKIDNPKSNKDLQNNELITKENVDNVIINTYNNSINVIGYIEDLLPTIINSSVFITKLEFTLDNIISNYKDIFIFVNGVISTEQKGDTIISWHITLNDQIIASNYNIKIKENYLSINEFLVSSPLESTTIKLEWSCSKSTSFSNAKLLIFGVI